MTAIDRENGTYATDGRGILNRKSSQDIIPTVRRTNRSTQDAPDVPSGEGRAQSSEVLHIKFWSYYEDGVYVFVGMNEIHLRPA